MMVQLTIEKNNEKFKWISFNSQNNQLKINASEEDMVITFLRFIATDAYNETISSLFEINVRHKNRAPVINDNFY